MLTSLNVDEVRARVEAASRLGALGAEARDLLELFRAVYAEAAGLMDATVFMFAVYDEESETVEVVRQVDRGVEHEGGSFPLGKGFTSEVIRTKAPRLVRRWSSEGPPVRLLYGTEAGELVTPQSAAIVPILSADRVLGVLSAQSYAPEAYEEADILNLGAIATQAAIAIKRLRANDLLAQEHERHALQLEAVVASMNDALLIVDARGAIVRLNRAARELLRLDSTGLVLGQPLEPDRIERWPEPAREVAVALIPAIAALRAGTSVDQVEIELNAGDRRVLSMSASLLRSSKGLQGGVIVFRDITSQRDLERLREDIFAMAWHDMQSPISVIRGHAELLLRQVSAGDLDDTGTKKAASLIVKHADRLADLLTTLFDIHCLEAGLLTLARWPVDLTALALDVTEGVRSTSGHRLKFEGNASLVGEWDERRIQQVLMNLLSNAMKYSPKGSTITVSATADGSNAKISVRDEGVGLDDYELTQVFRRGYRAPSARGVTGRGLGLYFSRGLIDAHGGRLWATSPGRGQGSTFCFSLPLSDARIAEQQMAASL